MKAVRAAGMLVVCGLAMAGNAVAAGRAAAPSAQEIAAKPELVVAAIQNQNAEDSAAIVVGALKAVFASDWPEAKKRQHCVAIVAHAVAAKGKEAAPMMGFVAARIPPAWLPVVAATAVVAAGDNSPALAKAMLEAVAGDAALVEACRAACADPSSVLSPAEIAIIRMITLPTPSQSLSKAPPLPVPRPAEKYSGQ